MKLGLLFTRLFAFTFGKKIFQPFYKWLYHLSLYGLNYANLASVAASGEKNLLKTIKKQKRENVTWTVFDIGANRGEYSELLLSVFGKEAITIHAFEPSVPCREILSQKFTQKHPVIIHPVGLGHEPATVPLYYDTQTSGLASVFPRRDYNSGTENFSASESITITTLDHFCREHAIEKIDFLKIDIEGNELNAFKGAHRMLSEKRIHRIQFEFGDGNIESRTFFRDFYDLFNSHYHLYRVVQNGCVPIKRYTPALEVFLGANYYAEHKNLS